MLDCVSARSIVLRFADGTRHSFVVPAGREEAGELSRHAALFPGKEVQAVEELVYAPQHGGNRSPFQRRPRPDLLALLQGEAPPQEPREEAGPLFASSSQA